jgi:membrane dipeptidase
MIERMSRIPPHDEYLERVLLLLDSAPMLDGHNDLAWVIRNDPEARGSVAAFHLERLHEAGDTDIPRLRRGRVSAQVWAAFVPTDTACPAAAVRDQIRIVQELARQHPDDFLPARTSDDILRAHGLGLIASILAVEGGVGLEDSLTALTEWYDAGTRLMTLCHSGSLDWVDSSTDVRRAGGLSAFGREVVAALNRMGIIVDCSHVSDEAAHQVLDCSTAPVCFSHSNARALCDSPRNMPDDLLRRVPANDGLVMATFLFDYVSEDVRRWMVAVRPRLRGRFGGERMDILAEHARRSGPCPEARLEQVADHIEHIASLTERSRVGIGSDFYGVPTTPAGLEDVSCFPFLLAEMLRRGWSEAEIVGLAGSNFVRLFAAVEMEAARLAAVSAPGGGRLA